MIEFFFSLFFLDGGCIQAQKEGSRPAAVLKTDPFKSHGLIVMTSAYDVGWIR